jgi:hypothetical protein
MAHTAKIAKILRRRIEKKIEYVLRENQFGFRRGKGTRDAIRMLRIISERTLEIYEELSVCFLDWQKAFDRINWIKLMQILKKNGIDWRERRLVNNLYMAQSVKVRLNRGETRSVKIGRGVRQGCCFHQFCSTCTANTLPRKLWRVERFQNRRANRSHYEICRRTCVTGPGRKGATGHDQKTN